MSEFFLELFTEEAPAFSQKNLRENLLKKFEKFFDENNIKYKKGVSFSTPNRLIILFEGLIKEIKQKEEEIKGPNINAPLNALEGFLRSNKVSKEQLSIRKIEKGEFYFLRKKSKSIKMTDLLAELTPKLLNSVQHQKSMKWADFNINWSRPLKSILAVFDQKVVKFSFHHLLSSNSTFIDQEFEDKRKIFKNFKTYKNFIRKKGLIIDHNERKKIIESSFFKYFKKKNLSIEKNLNLLDEVVNITDQPNVLLCKFDERFLKIPKEILVISMEYHQKYFALFDSNGDITNNFLVVVNKKDEKGLIKIGNERVIEARLSDAEFFWKKDKLKNLVKQISKLKDMNYFNGLGSYFDKVQRMRKIGALISDELVISKDKVELSASISKVDLLSDLVGEYPELQGILGGYFANSQGFDKDISIAISEHYLPIGLDSKFPKKPFSIALSISDKIDTLVGFFGIDLKPTSSKDPYALKRLALGVVRILIENKKEMKLKDLINYSINLYSDQKFEFKNKLVQKELENFLMERLKYYMKEKKIRNDIIEASTITKDINQMYKIYLKALYFNKVINSEIAHDIITTYKRASNLLESASLDKKDELSNTTDPGIFKNEYEKNLFKRINQLKKYFDNVDKYEKYNETLNNLASMKDVTSEFFDNVKVNEEDKNIKKNRLELLQMLCKTFENYIKFSMIESIK